MTGPDPARVARPASRRYRWGRAAIVLWFCALLAVPPLLLAAGLRPAAIENRVLSSGPGFSLARLLDTSWYSDIAAWFVDRLPGRDGAVWADAAIDLRLFGESPNPEVILGRGGWLYYRFGIEEPCYGEARVRAALAELAAAERALAMAGIRLLLVIAPNKDGLYPEHLGAGIDTSCTRADREVLRSAAAASGLGDSYLDTWALLEEEKAAGRGLVYYRLDSHWTSLGAGAVAAAVVDEIAPGLWDPAEFVPMGTGPHRGDMAGLLGLPLEEEETRWVSRPDVAVSLVTESRGTRDEAVVSTVPGTGTVAGETLLLHDSMGIALGPLLRPYFASLTTVKQVGAVGTAGPWFAERLQHADTLILVGVERLWMERLEGGLAGNIVAALAEVLPHREIPLEPAMAGAANGTRWLSATGRIATTGDGEAVVSVPRPGEPSLGGEQFLVVEMIMKATGTVRLTWGPAGEEGSGSLSHRLWKGEAAVGFRLPTLADSTRLELHISQGEGHRITRLTVVEIPPSDSGA